MDLRVIRLSHALGLPLPSYATEGAAGMDLVAALNADVILEPLGRVAVPTGLVLAIPSGYEGHVRARSGRALREGLAVLNGPGTIDSDYRGELRVLLINLGDQPITLCRGERIAQLVIVPVLHVHLVEVESLESTQRGDGGFGSTGT